MCAPNPRRGVRVLGLMGMALIGLTGCSGGVLANGASRLPADVAASTPADDPAATPQPLSEANSDGSMTSGPTATPVPSTGYTGKAAPVPWGEGGYTAPVTAPSAASGKAALSIVLDDGGGMRSTWTLTCDPAGGNHPAPAVACGVLGANGRMALTGVKYGASCTELYGGPQKVRLIGTWAGKKVNAEINRENGCQIARWDALLGLLPAASTSP